MRVWIAENNAGMAKTFEVTTSLPKIKAAISTPSHAGKWTVYRCDIGKISIDKVCALLLGKDYEESRDNEMELEVTEDGTIQKPST